MERSWNVDTKFYVGRRGKIYVAGCMMTGSDWALGRREQAQAHGVGEAWTYTQWAVLGEEDPSYRQATNHATRALA